MAAKAIKLFDGVSYLLPVTTSELVQMHGTTQSLTTYINDMKGSIANSAKAKIQESDNTGSYYVYISPTGNYDVTNGNVFTIVKGSNITLTPDATNNKLTITATSQLYVRNYTQTTTDANYSLITRYDTGVISNYSSKYVRIAENASGTRFAYYNPVRDVLYADYTYSKQFTENGETLANKYAAKSHTHDYAFEFLPDDIIPNGFTPTENTVTAIAYFNGDSSLSLIDGSTPTLRYTPVSLPTKKYIDDNFVTQTVFDTAQASGMHYLGDTSTLPTNPSSGDMYHVIAAITSIGAENGDFITYYKESGATTGSWSVWDKNVDKAIYAGTNTLTSGQVVVTDGTTGKVKTHAWPVLSIDTTVSSASHTFPVSIKYDAGDPNLNTAVSFEGDTGVTIQKKYYAGSAYISISYTPDHIGSGTTGHLTYWKLGTEHASLNSSYGSNTENNVQLHWIDNGVLKNVSVGVGSNSIPTYVDSSGHIKQVTSIDSSLYTNTDTKVQSTSSTTNANYPFLTKSTTGIGNVTQTALQSGSSTKYAYYNPSLGVAYLPYAYSTEFTENGTKLSNKYAAINHAHDVAFEFDSQEYTDTNDTVQVISYFKHPVATSIYLNTFDTTDITYVSTSVPTKKYIDDNFATKTELGNIQTGSEYTIVAASSSSTVNPPLLGMRNGYLNLVNSTDSTVEKSIYIHGNGSGTDIAITGGNVIDVGISHNQDHTGTGSTGCLTYWETNDEHTNVTSSYGANTTNAVGVHYIDSGVLKNVTVSSGSSSLPVYVDGGVIKPVTSTSLLKVYQQTSGATNAKYPFLTKYTSGVSGNTSGDYSRITSNGTDATLFAYVNPSTKISYFQYAYAGEFTEGGMRLEDKYALKGTGGTDTNTAKATVHYDDEGPDEIYVYISPTGAQDNTNGSTIKISGSGSCLINADETNNEIIIFADKNVNDSVKQYNESLNSSNYKYPLLTRYASNTNSSAWNTMTSNGLSNAYVRYTGSTSHQAAYYFPSNNADTSYLYIERIRTSSILLNGQSITSGGGSSSLDYTVVKNSMDAITIF